MKIEVLHRNSLPVPVVLIGGISSALEQSSKPIMFIIRSLSIRSAVAGVAASLIAFLCAVPEQRAKAGEAFRFTEISDKSLGLFEGEWPVFVYNHGIIQPPPGVPADRARSSYVHPIYGLDGEVLTDDFPKDHYHHRGLFWAWPHVRIGAQHYDLWMLKGIEHRFGRWLARDAGAGGATLGVENSWFVGERKVMEEQVWLRAAPTTKDVRTLDVDLTWKPIGEPLTLEGAEGKSYGGLTLRFAPRMNTIITTPLGQGDQDLTITRLPWADLSAQFAESAQPSGAAIFVAPDHPDFPPEWLTRHYGVLCLGWPGVKPKTFQPGETIRCRYRVWIHRGAPTVEQVKRAYQSYEQSLAAARPAKK